MKNSILLLIITTLIFVINGCKKTDQDKEWEKFLLGKWELYNNEKEKIDALPVYEFLKDNKGKSMLHGSSDFFTWEIKRKQLYIYYKETLMGTGYGHLVGYDQYYSRSRLRIHEAFENEFKMTMLLHSGFQRELYFKRITK